MNILHKNTQSYKPSLLIVLGIILVVTMIAQLAFLGIFGTRGKEIASIRAHQKELILENELLEAEIGKMQSLVRVKDVASEQLGMVNVEEVEYINPKTTVSSTDTILSQN